MIVQKPISEPFDKWPDAFDANTLAKTGHQKQILLKSIEMCFTRRIEFRSKCVVSCSKKIDTQSHDKFIVILQITRAQIITDLACEARVRR